MARRVTAGLARTGTSGSHFSGDLFLAFSTANPGAFRPDAAALRKLDFIPWEHLDPFFEAVVQATEEAVVNALVANEDMTGRDGHRTPALPRDRVIELLHRRRPPQARLRQACACLPDPPRAVAAPETAHREARSAPPSGPAGAGNALAAPARRRATAGTGCPTARR